MVVGWTCAHALVVLLLHQEDLEIEEVVSILHAKEAHSNRQHQLTFARHALHSEELGAVHSQSLHVDCTPEQTLPGKDTHLMDTNLLTKENSVACLASRSEYSKDFALRQRTKKRLLIPEVSTAALAASDDCHVQM